MIADAIEKKSLLLETTDNQIAKTKKYLIAAKYYEMEDFKEFTKALLTALKENHGKLSLKTGLIGYPEEQFTYYVETLQNMTVITVKNGIIKKS